jgi:MYXO-CTERM domain-containing protein
MIRSTSRRGVAVTASVGGILWLLPAERAEACSPPLCVPSALSPSDGATVPADGSVFFWRPAQSELDDIEPDPGQVILYRSDDPSATIELEVTEVEGGYALTPAEPLEEGTDYTLSAPSGCEGTGFDTDVEVQLRAGAPAPRPEELGYAEGLMHHVGELTVASYGGACSAQVQAARAEVELVMAEGARPWISLLHFETLVDGKPWTPRASAPETLPPGESWRGRGRDLIFTTCASEDDSAASGLAEGEYEVVLRATLPGTDLVLETDPVLIWLDCGEAGGDGDGDGDSEAAGCASSSPSGGAGPALVLLALALVLGARRRRAHAGAPLP